MRGARPRGCGWRGAQRGSPVRGGGRAAGTAPGVWMAGGHERSAGAAHRGCRSGESWLRSAPLASAPPRPGQETAGQAAPPVPERGAAPLRTAPGRDRGRGREEPHLPRHVGRVAAALAPGRPRRAARWSPGSGSGPAAPRPTLPPAQVPARRRRGGPAGRAGRAGSRAGAAAALGRGIRRVSGAGGGAAPGEALGEPPGAGRG